MANSVSHVLLTDAALQSPEDEVDFSAGAIVDFWGVVRELEEGRELEGIDYEAHAPMAEHQMKLIADEAAEKFQLKRIVLHHRIGFVATGEASLLLRVSAGHRGAAFDASQWIIDELKKKVTIWKKPRFRAASRIIKSESPSRTGMMAR